MNKNLKWVLCCLITRLYIFNLLIPLWPWVLFHFLHFPHIPSNIWHPIFILSKPFYLFWKLKSPVKNISPLQLLPIILSQLLYKCNVILALQEWWCNYVPICVSYMPLITYSDTSLTFLCPLQFYYRFFFLIYYWGINFNLTKYWQFNPGLLL